MHPMVSVLARRPALVQLPGVGIAPALDVRGGDGVTATTTPRSAPAARGHPGRHPAAPAVRLLPRAHQLPVHQAQRRWAILSGTLLLLSFVALFTRGLNFGIDFEGGTSWQVQMAHGRTAHVADVRDLLAPLGFTDAKVSILSGANGQSVNVQAAPRRRPDQDDQGHAGDATAA